MVTFGKDILEPLITCYISSISDNGHSPTKLTLANESQYLLLCRASVDFLRDKIQERCESGESTEPIGL